MDILEMNELEVGYDETLLGPLDLAIDAGVFLLVEGPNGIGKSTLLKTLIGLMSPLGGGYDWKIDRGELRFVPQTRTLDVLLPATVQDVLETGFQRGSGWKALRASHSPTEVERALELVGMGGYHKQLFREMSEGQKQLVLLARALLGDPKVILLDEPSASMDPEREQMAVDILTRERDQHGRTIFMIAHGSQASQEAADCVLRIDRDRNVTLD